MKHVQHCFKTLKPIKRINIKTEKETRNAHNRTGNVDCQLLLSRPQAVQASEAEAKASKREAKVRARREAAQKVEAELLGMAPKAEPGLKAEPEAG